VGPRLILFDVDQTLIYTNGAGRKSFERALEKMFGISNGLHGVSLSGRTDKSILYGALEEKKLHHLLTPDVENQFWDHYLRSLPEHLKTSKNSKILDGIVELLTILSETPNVFTGLLTGNIKRGAKTKLEYFDLWKYFPVGAFGDEHPDRNEVAKIALERSRRHFKEHFSVENVFVVGDSFNDIECAKAIGARSIIAATGSHSYEELHSKKPYSLFLTFAKTAPVLQALQGKPFFEPNGRA